MHWTSGSPAIRSEGRFLPKAPFNIATPAVNLPRDPVVDPQVVRDLVGLLLNSTRKMPQDDAFRGVALDYLRRKGLEPSPQRNAGADEVTA